jgi:GNAT superfamily N-acetyltransferase
MSGRSTGDEPCIRTAVPDDIPILAHHHRLMFEEIREKSGLPIDPSAMADLENGYADKLAYEFPSGACVSWVVQIRDQIVSSGAVSIVDYVPVPHDLSSRVAFLHSIYTEKEYRHRRYAEKITQAAADYCRNQGIRRLYLFASDSGRPLYEKIGFAPVPNMMLLLQ